MDMDVLIMVAGVLLTLAASYIPRFNVWFDQLGIQPNGENDGTMKRLVMLALLVLVAGGAFALSCTSWGPLLGVQVACTQEGAAGLFKALFFAIMANQSLFSISPKAPAVMQARALRSGQAETAQGRG